MKKLAAILLPFICLAFVSPSQAQTITVGSLDGTRSRAPLATGSGELSSARLRAALQSPTNFGPNGIVRCSVVVASGTPVITSAYLADKNVLFTSVFTGDLSASEAAAVRAFVARGGCIIADGNSDVSEQTAATSVVAAAGSLATIGPELACPNLSNGGAITGTPNLITNGPFGNVTGASWGTSISSTIHLDGREVPLVRCEGGALVRAFFPRGALSPGSGLIMFGGDPSFFDLFTSPSEFLFNPDNLIVYLNAVAACCGGTGFDRCLKDAPSGNILQWNSTTGDYQLTVCGGNGFMIAGRGRVGAVNGILSLTDNRPDRRVNAGLLIGQGTGSATIYVMIAQGVWQLFRLTSTGPVGGDCSCH